MQQISRNEIQQRLEIQNPWWREPHRVARTYSDCSARPYLRLFYPLLTRSSVRRALVLMGPRRVGKTFLIHHAIQELLAEGVPPKQIFYVSVDHPIYVGCSLEKLLEIYSLATGIDYSSQKTFIFFDEIQYLRNWEIHLKSIVDGLSPSRVVASGSAAAALRLKSQESGAGRFTDFFLPPLTFYEYLSLLDREELTEIGRDYVAEKQIELNDVTRLNDAFLNYLNFGGYPEVALSPEIQEDSARFVKRDIVDKVLLRDLPSLYGIDDIQELNSLFTTLAFNTAQEVSLGKLSTTSNVSKPTIRRYIEYLEAAFLIRTFHRVDRDGKHFKRANFFKVYLTNPSLRSALFSPVKDGDRALGALVETAIFSQWFHSESDLNYARWPKGEVDIVRITQEPGNRWAVEIKWSDRFAKRPALVEDAIGFCQRNRIPKLLVTTRTLETSIERPGLAVAFEPASAYAFAVGFNIIEGKLGVQRFGTPYSSE